MAGGGGTRLLDKQNPFGVGRRRYRIYGLIIVCIAVFNPVVLSTKHSQILKLQETPLNPQLHSPPFGAVPRIISIKHRWCSQHYKYDNARPNPAHQQIQLSPLSEARVSPPLLSNEVVSPPMSPDIFARPLHSTMLNRRLRKSESSFDEPKKQEINEKMHFGGSAGRVCRGRTGGANSIHAVSKLLKRSVLSDEIMVPRCFIRA
eukprot:jgi/Bigna1/88335/estExt_fgenesh1_pg.C_300182